MGSTHISHITDTTQASKGSDNTQPQDDIGIEFVSNNYVVDLFGLARARELLEAAEIIEANAPIPAIISKADVWQICLDNISLYDDEGHGALLRKLPKSSWSMIFSSVSQMPNLASGLRKFVELVPILQSGLKTTVKIDLNGAKLTIAAGDELEESARVERYIELFTFYFQCFLAWTTNRSWLPVSTQLSHRLGPQDGSMLAGVHGCEYTRDGSGVTFTYHSSDLTLPLGQRRSDRWAMNETVVFREILAGIAPIDIQENLFVEKVKALLQRGPHTQGNLATALYVSIPTLQRKLSRAGTNYRQLSSEIRINRLTLLLSTSMNLDDIASEMGFSDRRSLTRACHQWLGTTPSAYRKFRRPVDL